MLELTITNFFIVATLILIGSLLLSIVLVLILLWLSKKK